MKPWILGLCVFFSWAFIFLLLLRSLPPKSVAFHDETLTELSLAHS